MSVFSLSARTAERVANRVRGELMVRLPPAGALIAQRHEARLRRHRPALPPLEPRDQSLVDELVHEGVAITTLDEMGLGNIQRVKDDLGRLAATLEIMPRHGSGTIRIAKDLMVSETVIWRWGLTERLLDIVENYIGLPVRYRALPDVRCELANGEASGVRQWHRDVADHRQLKILIWLRGVDDSGGPFEYIPIKRTEDASRALCYVSGYVGQVQMAQVVPEREWRACQGPAWTVVLADTAKIFHRAKPPTVNDRYSVTFSYTSHHVIMKSPARPLGSEQLEQLARGLSRRQRACLPWPETGNC